MIYKAMEWISNAVWSVPTVGLIIACGLWFTVKTGFLQFASLKDMQKSVKNNILSSNNRKPLEAVSTALAATVGTGSVTGVATALTVGGPGAIFWLWVSAFFGMAVAYGEGVLSIKYRCGKKGGIMYAIRDGMKEKATALMYAGFTLFAAFGMGSMAQTNSMAEAVSAEFPISRWACAGAAAVVAVLCLFSKKDFTGKACSLFLPVLSIAYIALAIWVIGVNYKNIPGVFSQIFRSAFGIRKVLGGTAGYAVGTAISTGFKRGVFSNEAGLGTTAAIHAESEGVSPHDQGLMNMAELIIDTFVISTLTALAILTSGAMTTGLDGSPLVVEACKTAFGELSGKIVAISIAGFSIATVMGWSKIGLSAADYINIKGVKTAYKLLYVVSAFAGGIISLDLVWKISDIFNGLMVFPCMAALICLRKEIIKEYQCRPVEPKPLSPRSVWGS